MQMTNPTEDTSVKPAAVRILVIDDDRGDYLIIEDLLTSLGNRRGILPSYEMRWAQNFQEGMQAILGSDYDVCLLDYRLGPDDGLDLLRDAKKHGCDRPIILLTGFGNYELDVEAMSNGAVDFLVKDELQAPALERSIRYALDHWRAKQRLEESLREKEILLKEIHHRVKNNLQIICSLLKLQAQRRTNESPARILTECCDRVYSIALVHEKLYSSGNLEAIDITEYTRNLLENVASSYFVDHRRIKMKVEGESLNLPITTAIPCGLVLHELFANTFKHAFPENRTGNLTVRIKRCDEHTCCFEVSDDGVGVIEAPPVAATPESFVKEEGKSLGMQLIRTLVDQLRGKLNIRPNEPGTLTTVTFPSTTFSSATATQLN
jgi:two-component sensor histidine kinase